MDAHTGTCTMNNEFQIAVDESTETGHEFTVTWTATYESYSWNGTILLTAIGSDCVAPDGLTATASGLSVNLTWDDESTIDSIAITDDVEGHTYGTINSPGTVGWSYIDVTAPAPALSKVSNTPTKALRWLTSFWMLNR